jgi:transcriptional regulator with XRE-family HTH domain
MSTIPNSSQVGFLNLVSKETVNLISKDSAQGLKSLPPSTAATENGVAVQVTSENSPPQRTAKAIRGSQPRKLHRVAEVRVSQGVSDRTMCRRLNVDLKQLRAIEDGQSDMTLSQLAEIRDALEVPFADLLVENDTLARPVHERAKLLRIMKTAVSIKECNSNPRTARLAQMLCEQLIDLMPELADVGGWPEFGSRRGSDSVARILAEEVNTSSIRFD